MTIPSSMRTLPFPTSKGMESCPTAVMWKWDTTKFSTVFLLTIALPTNFPQGFRISGSAVSAPWSMIQLLAMVMTVVTTVVKCRTVCPTSEVGDWMAQFTMEEEEEEAVGLATYLHPSSQSLATDPYPTALPLHPRMDPLQNPSTGPLPNRSSITPWWSPSTKDMEGLTEGGVKGARVISRSSWVCLDTNFIKLFQ